jgi:dihydroorotase
MLEFYLDGKISIGEDSGKNVPQSSNTVSDKQERLHPRRIFCRFGFGRFKQPWKVAKENILYKCGWSPFEGQCFGLQ